MKEVGVEQSAAKPPLLLDQWRRPSARSTWHHLCQPALLSQAACSYTLGAFPFQVRIEKDGKRRPRIRIGTSTTRPEKKSDKKKIDSSQKKLDSSQKNSQVFRVSLSSPPPPAKRFLNSVARDSSPRLSCCSRLRRNARVLPHRGEIGRASVTIVAVVDLTIDNTSSLPSLSCSHSSQFRCFTSTTVACGVSCITTRG